MSIYNPQLIRSSLITIAFCFGATLAARADQIVFQTTFQPPATLGTYAPGSDVGGPGGMKVVGDVVSVVLTPCTAAGGITQCLLMSMSGSLTEMESVTAFSSGNYQVDLSMAGGSTTAFVEAALQSASNQGASKFFTVPANSPFTDYQFTTGSIGESGEPVNLYVIDSFDPALLNSATVTLLGVGQSPVPEPGSGALLLTAGLGFLGLAARTAGVFRVRKIHPRSSYRPSGV
jgi:hypothetical protein